MIQLLSSLIEWLAIITLSSVGIGMEPVSCAAVTPTEYRTVHAVYTPVDYTMSWSSETAADCGEAMARTIQTDDTPRLITETRRSYSS
ncbi:hypothetical protein [Maricaulis parjimensis]|uniref:hypothetical protein n=1 Tax=Maricaulis parjimensis TaxID=144023 RepID=UPI0019396825|nr:hypothetical protein [Maricaulis parjimensis]